MHPSIPESSVGFHQPKNLLRHVTLLHTSHSWQCVTDMSSNMCSCATAMLHANTYKTELSLPSSKGLRTLVMDAFVQVDPVLERAMEVILILHMDHEQNASTSTVRTAGRRGQGHVATLPSPHANQAMQLEYLMLRSSGRRTAAPASISHDELVTRLHIWLDRTNTVKVPISFWQSWTSPALELELTPHAWH